DVNTVATENKKDADTWGVTAIPHTTADPVQNVYGGDVMIPVTTPERQLAAWIFIKWFTSPEIQAEWSRISGYFPTRVSAGQFLTDYYEANPQWAQAAALLPFSYYEPQLISYTAVRDAAEEAFNAIMQGADVQATLDGLTKFANEEQADQMSEVQ
nr:extracellular solute-binding protein [Caldilineaceae bacterium]